MNLGCALLIRENKQFEDVTFGSKSISMTKQLIEKCIDVENS